MMRTRRLLASAGTVVALTAAGALSLTSAAQAGTDAVAGYYTSNGTLAASNHFYSYGDHGDVCDWLADGHSAMGFVRYYDNGSWHDREVWASGGVGSCQPYNFDFPENKRLQVRACIGERATFRVIACGNWDDGVS